MTDGLPDGAPLAGRIGGLAAVLLLHAGLIYALATSRTERPAPMMPPIQVRIIAEPQAAPTPPPAPPLALTPPDVTLPPEMPSPAAPPPEALQPPLPPPPGVAPAPPPEAPPVVAQPAMPEPPPPTPRPNVPPRPIPPRPLRPAAPRSAAPRPAATQPAPPQPASPRSAPTLPASPSRVAAPPAAAIPQASAPAVRTGPSRMASAGCDTPDRSAASARMGETGTVTVAVTIGADGSVRQSAIASSSGSRRLDETALAAIGLCRFRPALVDGKPEASKSTVRYHFE